jgi:hypothetical protein
VDSAAKPQRHREAHVVASGRDRGDVALELVGDVVESRVGVPERFRAYGLDDMAAPFGHVLDAGTDAVRMDGEAKDVDRRREQLGRGAGCEHVDRGVGRHELAGRSRHQRRVGQMALEDALERLAHGPQRVVVEAASPVAVT